MNLPVTSTQTSYVATADITLQNVSNTDVFFTKTDTDTVWGVMSPRDAIDVANGETFYFKTIVGNTATIVGILR